MLNEYYLSNKKPKIFSNKNKYLTPKNKLTY